MTIEQFLFLSLFVLTLHYLGDFVFQTKWMAENKSHNWKALSLHVLEYSVFLLPLGLIYAILNGALHFLVDAVTSRFTSHFFKTKQTKAFWVTIGADQLLHQVCLLTTLLYLG